MRIVVFSDLHVHPFRMFATFKEGDNSRRLEILRRLERIVELANHPSVDCLVFSGDFFEERGKVDVVSLARAKEILAKLKKPFIACSGNHDLTRSGYSALSAFRELVGDFKTENRRFFLDEVVKLKDSQGETWGFFCLPYREDALVQEWLEESMKNVEFDAPFVLVAHGNVKGEEFGLPFWIKNGFDPHFLMANFAFSVVGHYHMPFLMNNVLIPGAAIPHNFGDECGGGSAWRVDLRVVEVEGVRSVAHKVSRVYFKHPAFITVRDRADEVEFNDKDYYRIFPDALPAEMPENVRFVVAKSAKEVNVDPSSLFLLDSPKELIDKYVKRTVDHEEDRVKFSRTGQVLFESTSRLALTEIERKALEEIWDES